MEKKIEKFMEEQKEKEKKPSFFSRIWNHSTTFHGTEFRTVFFPLGVVATLLDEQRVKYIQSIPWSEARAKRCLDKWFLKIFEYDEEDGFSYCNDWHTSAVRPLALSVHGIGANECLKKSIAARLLSICLTSMKLMG